MNRVLIPVGGLIGALTPLVFDSALKGAMLLAAAACVALTMGRASAAARHLVWLVAIVALLGVPVLSVALPHWRILPAWAAAPAVETPTPIPPPSLSTREITNPATTPLPSPRRVTGAGEPFEPAPTTTATTAPAAAPALPSPVVALPPAADAPRWRAWLPVAWLAGFAVLLVRLMAAHLVLRVSTRSCPRLTVPPDDRIADLFRVACSQLGVTQRVSLLLDEKRTIPVVWGVFRPRLMLPAESREWSDAQLRSVLLHELAHVRRRDTLVQWLTQLACALHWWNPLVWFAAWRLHTERERACDDLVLASGVRASAYAEHLLHVATRLSPARWTHACGLAMARRSRLEGRLLAVLSERLNRRSVTRALTTTAFLLGAGIAIPIAMLRAADDSRGPSDAAVPPEARQDASATLVTGTLQPGTLARLKWGEPVQGLRLALAWPPVLNDALLGHDEYFKLVVQNVSDREVRFVASASEPNPRKMLWREGTRLVQVLSDEGGTMTDWRLQPGDCGVLRLFTKEERTKEGKTISSLLHNDLSNQTRYHVVATMEVAKAPEGAWTGSLSTGETRGSADAPSPPAPMHKEARALHEIWLRHARANGDIPGGLIGELADGVKRFVRYNPTWATVPQLNALLPRLDASRDWKASESIALLDEVASIQDSPLDMVLHDEFDRAVTTGKPLPRELADARGLWGPPDASGLRVAWELRPRRAAELMGSLVDQILSTASLGDALQARLLVHNTGKSPAMLRVPTFLQCEVKATDADGKPVESLGIEWTTRSRLYTCRLGPGEYVEINTPGIGFGKDAGRGPWAGPRVGWNILAQPGPSVRLDHAPVPLDGSESGRRGDAPFADGPDWWPACIKARLARELPLPEDAVERTHLLDRVVQELFGREPAAEERGAFAHVTDDASLTAFASRLAQRSASFFGKLQPAATWFNITGADPQVANLPRVVLGPGEYPLPSTSPKRGNATLKIVGRPVGDRRTNDARIVFEAAEATGKRAPDPHPLALPDGWGRFAIVCRPGEDHFYILQPGGARRVDFSDPLHVTDTPTDTVPDGFRAEAKRQLEILGVSAEQQAEILSIPAAPAATPDEKKTAAAAEAAPAVPSKPEANPPSAASEHVTLTLAQDGTLSWERQAMTLAELGEAAATNSKKWFTIRADSEVPYARVLEIMEVMRKAGAFHVSLSEARAGDGKYRVANRTGNYQTGSAFKFSICKLSSAPGFFTVGWPAKDGQPARRLRIHPVEPADSRGTWAVAWMPGTEELWWIDAADIGRMTLTDPQHVVVERSARVGARPPGFSPPDDISELFASLGLIAKDLWNRGNTGGDGNLWQRVLQAEPVKTSDSITEPHPLPAALQLDAKPVSTRLTQNPYAAYAVQSVDVHSADDVNFVLVYKGSLSTGMSESWSDTSKRWTFEGNLHLVDLKKTRAAGQNVDIRKIAVKYTSDDPSTLYLDGTAYDLSPPAGRVFLLQDTGPPIQTEHTVPLQKADDLPSVSALVEESLPR